MSLDISSNFAIHICSENYKIKYNEISSVFLRKKLLSGKKYFLWRALIFPEDMLGHSFCFFFHFLPLGYKLSNPILDIHTLEIGNYFLSTFPELSTCWDLWGNILVRKLSTGWGLPYWALGKVPTLFCSGTPAINLWG